MTLFDGQRYGCSPAFSLGVEQELLLVDRESLALAHVSEEVLPRMRVARGGAQHDLYGSLIELTSPISASSAEAVAVIGELRRDLQAAGGTPFAAGIHPDASFGDVRIVPLDRYLLASASMRGLMRRTPECALHVHVGLPDVETAIRAFNGLRAHLPVLQALAASTPFWYGHDSGLASARMALIREYPRTGIPRSFRDAAEAEEVIEAILAAGELADYTFLWWDIRLHPRLGTVEVRSLDSQSSLATTRGIAGLVRCLARREAERSAAALPPREAIAESSFLASRDGLDARVLHEGRVVPVREAVRGLLRELAPLAGELGEEGALEEVERVLATGAGADRQRAAYAGGGMRALLELVVRETAETR